MRSARKIWSVIVLSICTVLTIIVIIGTGTGYLLSLNDDHSTPASILYDRMYQNRQYVIVEHVYVYDKQRVIIAPLPRTNQLQHIVRKEPEFLAIKNGTMFHLTEQDEIKLH
jgi:hypothetical protein